MSYVGTGDCVRWECSQWVSDRVRREPPAPAVAPPSAVAEQGRQSTRQPPVLPFEALAVRKARHTRRPLRSAHPVPPRKPACQLVARHPVAGASNGYAATTTQRWHGAAGHILRRPAPSRNDSPRGACASEPLATPDRWHGLPPVTSTGGRGTAHPGSVSGSSSAAPADRGDEAAGNFTIFGRRSQPHHADALRCPHQPRQHVAVRQARLYAGT